MFVDHPFLAWVVAGSFVCLCLGSMIQQQRGASVNPWPVLLLAGVWGGYGVYERAMFAWSKTVTAPIRVDLLLIAPVLYVATACGLIAWGASWRRGQVATAHPAGLVLFAWFVVLWSGISFLLNLFAFHICMDIYRFIPAGELGTWLRSVGVSVVAVAFSAAFLLGGIRVLRRVRGAATVLCWLATLSLIWVVVRTSFKIGGLGLLGGWVRMPISLIVPVAWYVLLLWCFTRPSANAHCNQSS